MRMMSHQSSSRREPPLPIPPRPDVPLTDESIARAKQYNAEEREKATRECGIGFDADGRPFIPKKADVSH